MSRADPIARSDITGRTKAIEIDLNTTDKIKVVLQSAGIPEAALTRVVTEVIEATKVYKARLLADYQERPAAIVMALNPGLLGMDELREWLKSLPQSVRLDLKIHGIEGKLDEWTNKLNYRLNYWGSKVHAHRPFGQRHAGESLRQTLDSMLAIYVVSERKRRSFVAKLVSAVNISFPNEKKNRKKFLGRESAALSNGTGHGTVSSDISP
jgi:hypothetical protein